MDKRVNIDISTEQAIKAVAQEIERQGIDMTATYHDWLRVCFALVDELGEEGRSVFHTVSRNYEGYDERSANKQFDACLRSGGTGVRIGTFFDLAKQHGVNVSDVYRQLRRQNTSGSDVSTMSGSVSKISVSNEIKNVARRIKDDLPPFLQKIVNMSLSDEDADLLLFGSLATLSGVLPHVWGIYGQRRVYANLFLFVCAPASSGKGRLNLCRRLVEPIHREMLAEREREMTEYKLQMKKFYASKNKDDLEPPALPPQKMLIIPANASATSMYQVLKDSNEIGLMFESEGDTLAQTFKADYGNYSDGFRKAFHHESISYIRRKNKEHVEISSPRLSVVLSGTPRQINSLISDAENGLFSRFCYYTMALKLEWNDVFESQGSTADAIFSRLGHDFLKLYHHLQYSKDMQFRLTEEQSKRFNSTFDKWQQEIAEEFGEMMIATVRRLGLITYRIAMIINVLRMVEGQGYSEIIVCSDTDFNSSMQIAECLLLQSKKVFCELVDLPSVNVGEPRGLRVIEALPQEFSRSNYLDESERQGIKRDTARRHLSTLVQLGYITRSERGIYVVN